MLRFRDTRTVPPGGRYWFTTPGGTLEASSRQGIVAAMRAYYQAQGEPFPTDAMVRMEDRMCHELPPGFCLGSTTEPIHPPVTLQGVQRATLALSRTLHALPGEAARRQAICWKCALHDRRLCTSCNGVVDWAQRLVGRSVPGQDYLGICGVDHAALQVKLWARGIDSNDDYPVECWVRETCDVDT